MSEIEGNFEVEDKVEVEGKFKLKIEWGLTELHPAVKHRTVR